MKRAFRLTMQVVFLCAAVMIVSVEASEALECGVFYRDKCDEVCKGQAVVGCRSCGFWCEECECGPLPPAEQVCCHMKGATCDITIVPDAALWMSAADCDRFWGGYGDKICPDEACGKKIAPVEAISPSRGTPQGAPGSSAR